jgi:hypothetical protein
VVSGLVDLVRAEQRLVRCWAARIKQPEPRGKRRRSLGPAHQGVALKRFVGRFDEEGIPDPEGQSRPKEDKTLGMPAEASALSSVMEAASTEVVIATVEVPHVATTACDAPDEATALQAADEATATVTLRQSRT